QKRHATECAPTSMLAGGMRALIPSLVKETGYPRSACRRFARSMGVQPMRVQRAWTVGEHERLIKLLDLHPVNEIAKLMHHSRSSNWHVLYRLGANAEMGKDSLLDTALHHCFMFEPTLSMCGSRKVWLKARQLESGRTVIEAADFCEFYKLHTREAVGNR